MDKPDLIGSTEINVARDEDAILISAPTQHDQYLGVVRAHSVQEPKKVLHARSYRHAQIDVLTPRLLPNSEA